MLAILLFWLLIFALAAAAVAGLVSIYTGDRILAGTQALGRELGGMTPGEAAALLQADWQTHNIVLDAGEQSWTLTPAQVGAVLDAEATAARAYHQGRVELSPETLLPLATPETLLPLARRLLATAGLLASTEPPTLGATGLALRPGDGGRDSAHAGRPTRDHPAGRGRGDRG